MKPDIDLQLTVVIRALNDVVMPAVDSNNKPATEQIGLCLHMLSIVRSRLPYQRRFIRSEMRDSVAFLKQVEACLNEQDAAIKSELGGYIEEAGQALSDPEVDTPELAEKAAALKTVTSQLIQQLADHPNYGQIQKMGVAHAEIELNKARQWFADCGIDPQAASLPSLDEAL